MARRLLSLTAQSESLARLTRQVDQYAGELGEIGAAVYTTTLNEYKFRMRDRSSVGPLFKKTGRLRGSWDFEVRPGLQTLSGLRGSVFSHAGYSIIHEEGGVVRPANGRSWIFIPTFWNLSSNGTAKKTPTQVISAGGKYMRFDRVDQSYLSMMTFVSTSLLVDESGFPMFCLVKSASYAARLGTQAQMPEYANTLSERLADGALLPLEE